jgi:hypothetical protein
MYLMRKKAIKPTQDEQTHPMEFFGVRPPLFHRVSGKIREERTERIRASGKCERQETELS